MPRPSSSIKRLFIANRGEICRRIATSARSLGIETVCITDKFQTPTYLQGLISTFVTVEEETPRLYLDSERMIAIAREAGCDSIHPGFGFLSESSAFAAAVTKAGLIWIGPSAPAIQAMASKDGARKIAEQQGVPCPRSYRGAITAPQLTREIEKAANDIGFPLLVKAAGGGGGKGMRLVHSLEELAPALEQAHHEALHFFADGTLLLEQFISAARHIEVQILADQHGQVFAIGDRDCSLQRRKQKIIEEAPAPNLSADTRQALHAHATKLAKAVAYESAGTVEFLVMQKRDRDEIYFLEMNTRLQVEHPVTEEVFGLDLVALQLKIAQGYKLPESFSALQPRGHSIEARLYGEDYQRNFMPAPGFVPRFASCLLPGIRWELGLDASDWVPSTFDPMVAKVVAHADTREEALVRLGMCLEQTFYAGPASNKDMLIYFCKGAGSRISWRTDYLDTHLASVVAAISEQKDSYRHEAEAIAAHLLARPEISGSLGATSNAQDPVSHITRQAFTASHQQTASGALAPSPTDAGFQLTYLTSSSVAGHTGTILLGRGTFSAPGSKHSADIWQCAVWRTDGTTRLALHWRGYEYHSQRSSKTWQEQASDGPQEGKLCAPVPGRIVKVSTEVGAVVAKDQSLFLLESMKMEFDVRAACAGTIAEISVKAGDQVQSGQLLATIG